GWRRTYHAGGCTEAVRRHGRARHPRRVRQGAPAAHRGAPRSGVHGQATALDADRVAADGGMSLDLLLDLGLPGIVFLALCAWLVRRALRAALTERDLERDRLQGGLAEELRAGRARAEAAQRPRPTAVEATSDLLRLRQAFNEELRALATLLPARGEVGYV